MSIVKLSVGALLISLAACGGGSDGPGPDAADPMITTFTAHGVEVGVQEKAAEQLGGEAVLLRITGERVGPDGVVPPGDTEAYWQVIYVNPTTMMTMAVLSSGGNLDFGNVTAFDGDVADLITGSWRDSSEALAKLGTAAGFTLPTGGAPDNLILMTMKVFEAPSADDPRAGITDPFWDVSTIVGSTTQMWQIAFVTAMNQWLACDLSARECQNLEP